MTIFSDIGFFILVLASVPLFHLSHKASHRHFILFVSGIVFYTYNAGWWVILFFAELFISRFYRKGSRMCWMGALQALSVLLIFKYGHFIETTICSACGLPQGNWAPVLKTLPLAVSFFTFEFVHFAIDSHNGKIVERNFLKYASFIFFFPTLVAGPIKRYQDFTPKVEKAVFSYTNLQAGITRILLGFFKKFVVADCLVEWTKFLNPHDLPGLGAWSVWQLVFAYGFRIYFDFSGYADIAIGTALLFGIVVPENFDHPYFSQNISDFWKRWHISLYRWLVDYIFIGLGGSRGGPWKTCRNILIVTSVSGLWHGASWNFLLWGWYHGLLICIFHLMTRNSSPHRIEAGARSWLRRAGATLLTFFLVMFGWTFFALDIHSVVIALRKMFMLS